ncbi:Glutamyl aminopeptidase [Papilio xuthus]|uniref:Glutamyl aminopeptidase n=1 Tax=Papilio xuthus TaxID=66420 RepID=A0A0N1I2S2_PAPXU|nr:Glutamyl aminopeptidase [Papilio xuthus]
MHAKDLIIHNVKLLNDANAIIEDFVEHTYHNEMLQINLENEVKQKKIVLSITFTGTLDKKIVGFYASSLKIGGSMVASKFQPTYARQAFPCFDEPDFKATYDITLVKPVSYVALSNMNVSYTIFI